MIILGGTLGGSFRFRAAKFFGMMMALCRWNIPARSTTQAKLMRLSNSTEGETIIRKRERFSHELTLAYESGHITELKETKEAKAGDEKRS